MTWLRGSPGRALAPFGRVGGWLILVDQILQVALNAGGFRPGSPEWRYHVALLLSGRAAIIAVGSILIGAGLAAAGPLGPQRRWTIAQGAGCVLFLVAAGLLLVDGASLDPGASSVAGMLGAQRIRGILIGLVAALGFATFAVAGRRSLLRAA